MPKKRFTGMSHLAAGLKAKGISEQFYPADWMTDKKLGRASARSRGVWIEFLCIMWKNKTYLVEGTIPQLASDIRLKQSDVRCFIDEAMTHNFALCRENGTNVTRTFTIMSHRLKRRHDAKLRKRKGRSGEFVTDDVTPTDPPASPSSPPSTQVEGGRGVVGRASVAAAASASPLTLEETKQKCHELYGSDQRQWPRDIQERIREDEAVEGAQ